MRFGLTPRLLVAGGIVAVFLVVQVVLSQQSLDAIKQHTDEQDRAEQAVVAGIRLEKLALDL